MPASINSLPSDVIVHEILAYAGPQSLLGARCISRDWYSRIDPFFSQQWKKTKKLPPDNVIPLQKMLLSVENEISREIERETPASSLTYFRKLAQCFNRTYGIAIPPATPYTATEIEALQKSAKDVEDQSLVTFWQEIARQLRHLPNLPRTAAGIRAWMNNPANAIHLNGITHLIVVSRNLIT